MFPERPAGHVLDMHCHVAGVGAGDSGCYVSPALRRNIRYRAYLFAFGVTERQIVEQGDGVAVTRVAELLARSERVDGVLLLGLDEVVDEGGVARPDLTEMCVPGEFLAEQVKGHPHLCFGASVNPHRKDAVERLVRMRARGARLLKWLPAIQRIDPADRRHIPFYETLCELGMPLLTHTGSERSFTRAVHALGDPERLRLPLEVGVTVIAAHGASGGRSGGEPNHRRLARMFVHHPNLYTDISSLTQLNRIESLPRLLARKAWRHRLLYGSDMPLINLPLVRPEYFIHRIGLAKARAIARLDNPWDRDVEIKRALGVEDYVFTRAAELLGPA